MKKKFKDKLQSSEGLTKISILNEISLDSVNISPEESQHYNQQALDLLSQIEEDYLISPHKTKWLNLKASTLLIQGKIFRELNDIEKSKQTFKSILTFDQNILGQGIILEVYLKLFEIYKEDNDLKSALEYFEKYVHLKHEIHQTKKNLLIDKIESEYELGKKQKEAEIYKLRNIELVKSNQKLVEALEEINTLNKLLPICASCKKIRNDRGYWEMIENYLEHHSQAQLINSLCPKCAKKIPD